MRLIFVAHAFPRWPGDVAGSFLGRLGTALVARGHAVSAVVPADRGQADRRVHGGVDVVPVRYAAPARENLAYTGTMARAMRSPANAWAFRNMVHAMRRAARAEADHRQADLLHAFWWVPAGWAIAPLALPRIVSLMGTDVAMLRSWAGRWLGHRVLGRVSHVTSISTYLADEVRRQLGRPDMPITRVPMPVATERFTRRSQGGGGIVYLGRLSAQKRVTLLLDAIHATGLTAPVTIVGDGPARRDLEQHARALGLTQVRFTGTVPDDALHATIGDADVMAFPSEREGLGLAAAEALMMGVPVVATTDGGGVLDLVQDGKGAAIVTPDPTAFGSALARCLGDSTMRAGAVVAGDGLRAALAPESIAKAFERVYEEVTRG